MKYWALLAAIFTSFGAKSQKKNIAAKFAAVINAENLRTDLRILAGDEMEGRATATEGQRKAAAYIQQQFINMGLKAAPGSRYQLPFPVYQYAVEEAAMAVDGINYKRDTEFGVFTDFNHACDLKFSELVFAGYGISDKKYDSYKDLDVAGKLVVVYGGEPKKDSLYLMSGRKYQSQWSFPPAKAQAATRLGASALLIIQPEFPMKLYNNKLSGLWISPYRFYNGVNTFFIDEKIARDIFKDRYDEIISAVKKDSLTAFGLADKKIDLSFSRKLLQWESSNVLGVLEGSDKKDEYVFITAHYDHLGKKGSDIYHGADDDGSGTVAVLQLAKAFVQAKQEGKGPRRTIVFMLLSGEENGLWGSDEYVSHPAFPLEKTTVDLNMDMIGRTGFEYQHDKDSTNSVYVIGDDKLSSDLRPVNEKSNRNIQLKLDYKYNNLNDPNFFFYRSDHYNFARKGVPIIFYTDGEHADYHKPSDTFDKINYELLSRRARLVFYTAWEIANMDRMLKRDIPLQ